MTVYTTQNQWGGSSAPWNDGGVLSIGNRADQKPIALQITSSDDGQSFTGSMTYQGEGPIGFRGKLTTANTYHVENQWGGDSAPWNDAGLFLLGGRADQKPVAFDLTSSDGGQTLTGTMTYAGEGPIGVKGSLSEGVPFVATNQWGGDSAPWNPGGTWVLGCRPDQGLVAINANTAGAGGLSGTMTYNGEGPIGLDLVPGMANAPADA